MLAVWLAYLLGKEQGQDNNPYPNGKPCVDYIIEAIAIVFVLILMIFMYFGS
jgi:hypothetical protein